MKILTFFLALVLGAAALRGQSVDESDVVVSLSAEIIWGVEGSHNPVPSTAMAKLSCYALYDRLGASGCTVTTTRGSSLPGISTPIRLNTRLIPGATYTVVMTVDNDFDPSQSAPYQGTQGFYLNAVVPDGYVVELGGVPGCEQINDAFCNNAQSSLKSISIRVLSAAPPPALGPGMATSLGSEKKLWQLSLGSSPNGMSTGTLSFNALASSASLASIFTRANLSFDGASPTGLYFLPELSGPGIRQIMAPQVCVVMAGNMTSGDIELKCYHPSQRSGTDSNGYFTFTGDPFAWYKIQPQGSDSAGVLISCDTRTLNPGTKTGAVAQTLTTKLTRTGTAPDFTWTADAWHTGSSAPVRTVRARIGLSETITVQDAASVVARSSTRSYTSFASEPIGDEVTQESAGGSNPIVNSFSFYTGTLNSPAYGKPKIVQTNSGGWSGYEYNSEGRLMASYGPFSDSDAVPSSLPASGGVVTTYTYSPGPWDRNSRLAATETKVNGTTVSKSETTYVNETPFSAYSTPHPKMQVVKATRTDYAAASSPLTTVSKQFAEDAAPFFRGQVHSVEQPDKVKQSFVYQNGSWNGTTFTPSNNDGLDVPGFSAATADRSTRIAVFTGTADSAAGTLLSSYGSYPVDPLYLIPGKSTLEITIRDGFANVVYTETRVWSSGSWNLVSSTSFAYNLSNQLTSRTASNGDLYEVSYSGEHKSAEKDDSGIELTYVYDAAGRVDTATRAAGGAITALTTKFAYDSAGQVTQQTVGHGLSETLVSSRAYDTAGRVTSESSPGPNGPITTTFIYNPAARQVTATLPNGGTRVETYQRDRRLKSVTGTAVIPEYFTYDSLTGGIGYTRVNLGTSASARLKEGWTDWLGRTTKTSRPGFATQPAFEEQTTYDATSGRLIKATRSGLAPTLYEYDALSQPIRSGLDLDINNTLGLSSADRIADSDQYFEIVSGAWWLTKVAKTYPTASSATPLTVSTTRQRLNEFSGNLRAETVAIDVDGNTTTQKTSIDRPNKTTTIATTTNGLLNTQTETSVNGYPTGLTRFDGLTYTTGYDALGRRHTSTDPRTGATAIYYKTGSPFTLGIWGVIDLAGIYGYLEHYDYDAAGRVIAVTNADNKITRTSYNTLDRIVRRWGDATNPVEFGYNTLGERVTMKTYRGGSGWGGTSWPGSPGTADWTKWEFDTASGLLKEKYDAANLNASGVPISGAKKVTFSYNHRGQTATRTWARNVTTTYGYDNSTGELLTQTYSDSTPSVTYTYTRAGQLESANDTVTGLRSFVYNPGQPLRLDALSLGSFYGNRVQTRQYDAIKRPAGFLLGITGNLSADITQTQAYHAGTGRFESVASASSAQSSRTFSYTYNTGGLVAGLGIPGSPFSVERIYEPHRNLLTSLSAKWNSTARTRYDYAYNGLGQRATAKQSGDVFADFGGSTYYRYAYNARGEVTEAVDYQGEDPTSTASPQLADRRFGYVYDPIGNRSSATRALGTSVTDAFGVNSLNQYTSQENDVAYVAGTARTDSMVAVTGGTTTSGVGRAGRYWGAQVTLNNTSGPAKTDLTVTATLASPNVARTEVKTAYLPSAAQTFSYDDDGNLVGDGIWNYAYDAENRLITMTATATAKNAGFADRLLEFKYDYLGRRVQKRSATLSANGGFTPGDIYRRYLYDGWNLVAEFDATSSSIGSLVRSYTWGLDLAGSLSATGGVGALVQISDHTSSTSYFPTYDGNGNVASLLRASDGAAAAKYEYSPFGELLRAEGSYAASNPFRFSTKFTDDESGLVYYGARFYSPGLGRFINRDPIAEQGGLNLYGFAGNDGINGIDVHGLFLKKLFKSIGKFFKKYWKPIVAVVASIVTYGAVSGLVSASIANSVATTALSTGISATAAASFGVAAAGTVTGGLTAGIIGGAAAGFVGGATLSGLNGGNIGQVLKSGLRGAAGGAIMGGIAGYYGNSWSLGRVTTTSIGGGLASEVSGGSFHQGALISGAVAMVTYGAIRMREYTIAQSKLDSRNATKDSVGLNGDEFGAGGGRFDERLGAIQRESELGGFQGGQGAIRIPFTKIRWEYSRGSFSDRFVEAYSGVHDFFNNPWSYNPQTGNYNPPLSIFGRHLEKVKINAERVASAMNWIDVPLTTPIVATSAVQLYAPNYISIYNRRGGD